MAARPRQTPVSASAGSPASAPDDLFGPPPGEAPTSADAGPRPLADRLRPRALEEVVGQDHLVGPEGALTRMLARGSLASLILWGPPGVGKTTIARLLAERAGLAFVQISAVFSGVADLKRTFDEARLRRRAAQGTLLFVDEIHRFNRAQQDGFLPVVEDGTVTLVGATTENPSFALNGALLSRCQVLVLRRLDDVALDLLLTRAEAEAGHPLPLDDAARATLRAMADGDGRYLLNLAEQLAALPEGTAPMDPGALAELLARRAALYDKDREEHYNLISALHKSLRGSDPDAALYWFARMLQGGEDPRYIARRLTRFAAEDVGMADPRALPLAIAAWETYERLGSPEGELALAQLVVHLGTAPKSNAVYAAWGAAQRAAKETGSLMPPAHILNAPTKLMKQLGYGAGYAYDHDEEEAFSGANYFPDGMPRASFYRPTDRGAEAAIRERMQHWAAIRARKVKR
ncbi:replication-associated recombination protein A [Dankookia rubra]|uniref:Replication-associated recombination protein A n=1 Tax=Dankookia rubra TaxID=1442381 RepID=A0A4R5Q8A0_9PROT|nr:replication-associated recombination protein A [Dankookia rubra]TDH58337.1 replication-associated recombination protein A [Dankookia rubra]